MDAPAAVAMIVGLIGFFGLLSGLRAAYEIGRERIALRKGRAGLEDLPIGQESGFDYRGWIEGRDGALADSHFSHHVLAAANATKSGRAVTLHELHEISARREARRFSARLASGVAALLLVCGIAGTLWAIKPVLGTFDLNANRKGEIQAATSAEQATRMIHDLGNAFWPSLIALVLTVLVAFTRGLYAHGRGELAGELDQLDLEDLFHRFPPRSLSQDLDGVRGQLAELAAQMLASQHNLDGFVQRLTEAASQFHTDAPPLRATSIDFVAGIKALSPRIDALNRSISTHLSESSPLASRFDGMLSVSDDIRTAAAQMQLSGTVVSKHLLESHRLLKETADALPAQLQVACNTASGIIADATANALANACTSAVERLEGAAAPLRDAARSVAAENQALKADTSQSVATLTIEVRSFCDVTTQTMLTNLHRGLDELGRGVEVRLDSAQQEFREAISMALATISGLHTNATEAISRVAETVGRMEQLQPQITMAVARSSQMRNAIEAAGDKVDLLTGGIGSLTQQFDEATSALVTAQKSDVAITERIAGLAASIGGLTSESDLLRTRLADMQGAQDQSAQRIGALIHRAEQIGVDWQQWFSEVARLQGAGITLSAEIERILVDARHLTGNLADSAREVANRQQVLASDVSTLTGALAQTRRSNGLGYSGYR